MAVVTQQHLPACALEAGLCPSLRSAENISAGITLHTDVRRQEGERKTTPFPEHIRRIICFQSK